MRSQQPIFAPVLLFALFLSLLVPPVSAYLEETPIGFTLQVAAFPETAEEEAEAFVGKLMEAGEQPVWGIVEIRGRGLWVRVYIGSYTTSAEARHYGEKLVARHLIKEFLVKRADEIKALSRPRSVGRPVSRDGRDSHYRGERAPGTKDAGLLPGSRSSTVEEKPFGAGKAKAAAGGLSQPKVAAATIPEPPPDRGHPPPERSLARPPTADENDLAGRLRKIDNYSTPATQNQAPDNSSPQLNQSRTSMRSASAKARPARQTQIVYSNPAPASRVEILDLDQARLSNLMMLLPPVDTGRIPRCDPVRLAFQLLASPKRASQPLSAGAGGLWVSGDVEEALARLHWIAGVGYEDLVFVEDDGRVQLDLERLVSLADVAALVDPAAALRVVDYIIANEGLLLLVQLTQSRYRYRLHLGSRVAAFHGMVNVNGSINLDTNFDSRINPYRRLKRKLHSELPPFGFDSLIALNPAAQWFNTQTNRFVPVGHITFHELVEAFAKVELGYEYLPQSATPGAHNTAIEREVRLKAQRPTADLVLTIGSNRVIKSDEERRQLTSELGNQRQQ